MNDDFSAWVGRSETLSDILEPARTNALRAALGETPNPPGRPLPLLHHWLYFWDVKPPEELGVDGHPVRGGFLPPVRLPRRMWAGGRLKFLNPLIVGEQATKVSTILDVRMKSGKSGNLVFVTVKHELSGKLGLAIVEEQDIVYREAATPGSIPAPAAVTGAPAAEWRRDLMPDPVLLFRYSALTMNAHRIHYDRPYAVNEEAYPGLVAHGPLQATLLAGLAVKHVGAPITEFDFRSQAPAFGGVILHVCGEKTKEGAGVWTQQGDTRNMVATVRCG